MSFNINIGRKKRVIERIRRHTTETTTDRTSLRLVAKHILWKTHFFFSRVEKKRTVYLNHRNDPSIHTYTHTHIYTFFSIFLFFCFLFFLKCGHDRERERVVVLTRGREGRDRQVEEGGEGDELGGAEENPLSGIPCSSTSIDFSSREPTSCTCTSYARNDIES